MKSVFKIMMAFAAGLLLFACQREAEKSVLTLNSPGTVSASASNVVLNELKASENAITYTWTNPVYGIDVVPAQTLEFAKAGTSFKTPVSFDLQSGTNKASLTHLQLNSILASLRVTPDIAGKVDVRLKSSLNTTTAYYSEPITLTVTPYTPNPDLVYPKINVPGGYAAASGYANWTPSNSPNLFSPLKDGKYYGFVYMRGGTADEAQFKFTIKEDWPGNKGDDGTKTGKLKDDGANIVFPLGANTYYLKVDWAGNTYSMTKANFGILGDATPTGWGADTKLVYNPATHKFEIPSIALMAQKPFKFRANDDWVIKIQPTKADQTLVSGKAVQTYTSLEAIEGDANYMVSESGNYKVELDLHNSAYYNIKVTKL